MNSAVVVEAETANIEVESTANIFRNPSSPFAPPKMPNIVRGFTTPNSFKKSTSEFDGNVTIPSNIISSFVTLPSTPEPIRFSGPSLRDINNIVNKECQNSSEQYVPPEAIIKPEDIIPISSRPSSPKDNTLIIVGGEPLNRESILPIQISDVDTILPSSHIAQVKVTSVPNSPNRQIIPPSVTVSGSITTNVEVTSVDIPDSVTTNVGIVITSKIPNYSGMSLQEQAHYRANFRTKFGILREAWPNFYIPDIPDTLSLEEIHTQYDVYIRNIHINKEVDQYKVYLVIVWLVIEFFCIKIGLNIGGYTVVQMKSMNKYERLLMELGESNHKETAVEVKSNWPVEIRIIFMALVNAVMFIIIKMLASFIGDDNANKVVDTLSSYLSGTPIQPGQLFGGNGNNQPQPSGQVPGGQPVPENTLGGFDVVSLIGTIGNMVLSGQKPLANNAPVNNNVPTTPNTPKFRPAYDE